MRVLVYFLFLICFFGNTHASEYFDFSSKNYLIGNDGEVTVAFHFNLVGIDDASFIVRPEVSHGSVYIFDVDESVWIEGNDAWTKMPELKEKMQLKVLTNEESDLSFIIQNIIVICKL